MANISKVNFNGNNLDVKDAYAREQILHKTADNYTADVSGDYTVNAGDIAMSSANTTMHTTADRTIDTDGNDSVHIDGASTLNVGGLRTETFAGDKTETVNGTTTEKFSNVNTTVTGKWMVKTPSKSFNMADVLTRIDKTEVVLIGDSWIDYKSDKEHVRIPQTIESTLGLTVHNYSHGGTGFLPELGYMEQLDEFKADTSFDHEKVKYLVLVAGLNEYNPQTPAATFTTYLQNWVDKARTITDAPIYWFFDYSMQNDVRPTLSRNYYDQRSYFDYIQTHVSRDITCVNMQGWVEFSEVYNGWNTANYYHPIAASSENIGTNICNVMQGIPPKIFPYCYVEVTWNGSSAALSKTGLTFTIHGDVLWCTARTPTYANGTTVNPAYYETTLSHPLPAYLDYNVTIAKNLMLEAKDLYNLRVVTQDTSFVFDKLVSGYDIVSNILMVRR